MGKKRFTSLQFTARLDNVSLANSIKKSRKLPTNTTQQSKSRVETMYFNIRWVRSVNEHASLEHVPVTSPVVTLTQKVCLDMLFICLYFCMFFETFLSTSYPSQEHIITVLGSHRFVR